MATAKPKQILIFYVNIGSSNKAEADDLVADMRTKLSLTAEEMKSGRILKQIFIPCRARETSVEVINLLN